MHGPRHSPEARPPAPDWPSHSPNDPVVVLADEPTGELDRAHEELVLELLASRAREGGAVCVVTHSELVAAAADRVVRIEDGKVVDG